MTDRMYGDQYDELFPAINNGGEIQIIGDAQYPEELIYDIKYAYLKYILDCDIPTLSQIMEYLEEKIEDKVFDYARSQYGELDSFWNDSEFREAVLLDSEDIVFRVEGYEMYESCIRHVLGMLRCTYIDDDFNYPGYGEIVNDAQLDLFQSSSLVGR